jgi:CRP/FNR family transcriptional regulator, cyclic AMP receptor protein
MQPITERIIRHPFFAGMEEQFFAIVILNANERVFAPGEIIFREGKPASHFYLIESGSVGLEMHEPGDGTFGVQDIKAGEVLGWSWLFPPFVWHFQARALDRTRAIVLDGAHLLVAAEQNKRFGYDLLKRVSRTMMQRLYATRKRLIERELEAALTD